MKKAVITADIVQSTRMTVEQRTFLNNNIKKLIEILIKLKYIKAKDVELYRGDSLQCLIEKPEMALRVALLIKTGIKSFNPSELKMLKGKRTVQKMLYTDLLFDIRLSLAMGEVQFDTGQLATADGEAFRLSGRKLDEMKKEKRSFCISTSDEFERELDVESFLLDTLLSRSTALQCQVMFWKVHGYNELKIAKGLGINQSAVNQRSTSGGWHAVDKMIKRFDEMYGV